MKIQTLTMVLLLTAFGACRKELDLDPEEWYGVRELLRSANLHATCNNPSEAEGMRLGWRGKAPEDYREPNAYRFFLLDLDKEDCRIEVQLDTVASSEVFAKLATSNGRTVRVRGILEGYDQPGNRSCKRGYILRVEQSADVELE